MARNKTDATGDDAVTPETPRADIPEVDPETGPEPIPDTIPDTGPENRQQAAPGTPDRPGTPADGNADLLEAIDAAEARQTASDHPGSQAEPAALPPGLPPAASASDPEPHPDHPDDHEDDAGPSFASRALTGLVLLLAGAALGIWAAPRLAPLLPAGMAPVATWLAPGQSATDQRIASIETSLVGVSDQVAALAAAPDPAVALDAAIAETRGALDAEIAGLRDEIGRIDPTANRQRLAELTSTVEGQAAELATIKDQLTGSPAASGTLSDEAAAQIDVYRAELDGLQAEVAALSGNVGALDQRIDEIDAEAEAEIEAAQTQVAEVEAEAGTALDQAGLQADLALIRAAIAGGQPFDEPAARLAGYPDVTLPEGLDAAAATGVAPLPVLRDSFPDAAHDAIQASILASAGDGVFARSQAYLRAQVASRSLTPREGLDPDAVLSRVEDRLRQDDLEGALAEAEQLPTEAVAAMSGWLNAARLRLAAETGLATLTAAPAATN